MNYRVTWKIFPDSKGAVPYIAAIDLLQLYEGAAKISSSRIKGQKNV